MIYPKPYSIYSRGTIGFWRFQGLGFRGGRTTADGGNLIPKRYCNSLGIGYVRGCKLSSSKVASTGASNSFKTLLNSKSGPDASCAGSSCSYVW